mmetsp:Transcript_19261/g.31648  ORF Transcript_19261/g.31648 Transcript_19261/m.31648 type:complete len:145 (+) Transcript_19261:127-561(+)
MGLVVNGIGCLKVVAGFEVNSVEVMSESARKKVKTEDDGDLSELEKVKKELAELKKLQAQQQEDENDGVKRDDDGNVYFELSSKRRVTVSKYRSAVLVDVREMYEKDGQVRRGNKGISLTVDQFRKLCSNIEDIEGEIKKLQQK